MYKKHSQKVNTRLEINGRAAPKRDPLAVDIFTSLYIKILYGTEKQLLLQKPYLTMIKMQHRLVNNNKIIYLGLLPDKKILVVICI